MLKSELTDIQGIGQILKNRLLTKFGSVKRIQEAEEAQLSEVVGKAAAARLIAHFAQNQPPSEDIRREGQLDPENE